MRLQIVLELDRKYWLAKGLTEEEFEELEAELEATNAEAIAGDVYVEGFFVERVRYTSPPHEVINGRMK